MVRKSHVAAGAACLMLLLYVLVLASGSSESVQERAADHREIDPGEEDDMAMALAAHEAMEEHGGLHDMHEEGMGAEGGMEGHHHHDMAEGEGEEGEEEIPKDLSVYGDDGSIKWDIERWDTVKQLSIRRSNPMWRDREEADGERQRFRSVLLEFRGYTRNIFFALLDKFYGSIGGNGIIEVMDYMLIRKEGNVAATGAHLVGEYLYEKGNGVWEDISEIVGRNLLKKAPLHAAVWQAIVTRSDVADIPAFSAFVDNLCWFRHEPGLSAVYTSCVHGVGHGLAKVFEADIDQAIRVCEEGSDEEYMYSCASGIFMEEHGGKMTWSPCGTHRCPAACFRFKGSAFRYLADLHEKHPCSLIESRYHRMGCVWGAAYLAHEPASEVADRCFDLFASDWDDSLSEFEVDLYLACLSGGWEANRLRSMEEENARAICLSLPVEVAIDFCLELAVHPDEGAEVKAWDTDLLEKYRDPRTGPLELPFPVSQHGPHHAGHSGRRGKE